MKTVKPSAIIAYMANKSGESRYELSRKLNKNSEYIGTMIRQSNSPRLDSLASVAKVCGYEVHIIGHGEDITVEVPEE